MDEDPESQNGEAHFQGYPLSDGGIIRTHGLWLPVPPSQVLIVIRMPQEDTSQPGKRDRGLEKIPTRGGT